MKVPQLFCGAVALALLGAGCHRDPSHASVNARAAAAEIQSKTAETRDRVADAWIATKIKSKLVGDREIRAGDIDVSAHDGVVTLKGQVVNEPLRQLAITLAKNTDGVKQVDDQLSVQVAPPAPTGARTGPTPGAVATTGAPESAAPAANESADARIRAAIQSRYFVDDRLKRRHIDVNSSGGVVTLNGEVADETERAQALMLARSTSGVTRVEDGLTTEAAAAPQGDEALTTRVQSQLSTDPQINGAAIEVTSKNGVVLLEGTVTSGAAKQRALTLARGTDGVTQVVDRIHVGPPKR